jgi:hypothetical protein
MFSFIVLWQGSSYLSKTNIGIFLPRKRKPPILAYFLSQIDIKFAN